MALTTQGLQYVASTAEPNMCYFQAMPMLLQLMEDPNQTVVVKDSVAWTLGRICEILPQVATGENAQFLVPLVTTLLKSLDSEPRVAANVCWVSLAQPPPPRKKGGKYFRPFCSGGDLKFPLLF